MSRRKTSNSAIVGLSLLLGMTACSASTAKFNDDIEKLRETTAEHTAQMERLNSELRQLRGKIEELEYSAVGKTQELENKIRTFSTRVPPPPGVSESLLSKDEEAISRISGPAADTYKNALAQIRSGDFSQAQTSFSTFAQQNPGTAFTDNALFWSGVSSEQLNQFDKAIVAYSQVYQSYPAEDMVPAAIFRLGETFAKMGSYQDAVITLQKLVAEYPRSEFRGEAQAKIRDYQKRSSGQR